MDSYKRLLLNHKAWMQEKLDLDPEYFHKLSEEQKPEFLWIGCADSRVPATEITGMHSGDVFEHRNVANLMIHTDLNSLSVLQYAVEHLHVKHIIVCGHYKCGGVQAALGHDDLGMLNKWVRNVKDVYRLHQNEMEAINDPNKRWDRLVQLNVKEQVLNLSKTSIVQRSWAKGEFPVLHGWVYDLHEGDLEEIVMMTRDDLPKNIYTYDSFGDYV